MCATVPILTQPNTESKVSNARSKHARQLAQLHRHDPTAAAAAERLLAAGFPEAARHRIRQAMHQLLDRLAADQKVSPAPAQAGVGVEAELPGLSSPIEQHRESAKRESAALLREGVLGSEDRKQSRREFLKRALIAGTAAAGALSLPAIAQAVESNLDSTPIEPLPFGPADRTQTIDHWIAQFDTTIIALERTWSFLLEARTLPAHQVDGSAFLALENAARDRLDGLQVAMNEAAFDDLFKAAAGHSSFYYCLAADIRKPGANRDKLQACILDYGQDYPQAAAELQAMLDARCEVV